MKSRIVGYNSETYKLCKIYDIPIIKQQFIEEFHRTNCKQYRNKTLSTKYQISN